MDSKRQELLEVLEVFYNATKDDILSDKPTVEFIIEGLIDDNGFTYLNRIELKTNEPLNLTK